MSGDGPLKRTPRRRDMCFYEYYWDGFNYWYQWICF
jgi:hypothetical protein